MLVQCKQKMAETTTIPMLVKCILMLKTTETALAWFRRRDMINRWLLCGISIETFLHVAAVNAQATCQVPNHFHRLGKVFWADW